MKRLLLTLFLITGILSVSPAQTDVSKAQSMFIYNFSRLIEWPADYKSGDFVIGVLGNSNVYDEITAFTSGKKVGVQNIVIQKYKDPSEIGKCHILFVSFAKTGSIQEINNAIGSKSTLIIAEKTGAINDGAAINFVIDSNKLKFELKTANATKHSLKVSSSLENMAILVN